MRGVGKVDRQALVQRSVDATAHRRISGNGLQHQLPNSAAGVCPPVGTTIVAGGGAAIANPASRTAVAHKSRPANGFNISPPETRSGILAI
jgi:hypothetical protein